MQSGYLRLVTGEILIIGQGLAGTLLSFGLFQRGISHRVVDRFEPQSASRVAAGLMNPLAGRALSPAAHWDRLMPSAESLYRALEQLLDRSFYHQRDFLTVFANAEDQQRWLSAAQDPLRKAYLDPTFLPAGHPEGTHSPWGAATVRGGAQLDVAVLLDAYRAFLKSKNMLVEQSFRYDELKNEHDQWAWGGAAYRHVIFCEGYRASRNPWFDHLPWRPNLGERLLIDIPNAQWSEILRRQGLLAPAPNGLFWLGSANQWNPAENRPTEKGRAHLNGIAQRLLDAAWTAVDHAAAIRPSLQDRRPVVGPHPAFAGLWTLNGLGTKGSSWCPWHADRLASVLSGTHDITYLDQATLPSRF